MEKRLYKSSNDKILAGVCGGIGEYFEIDPVLIRILWVISAFVGGAGVLAYIVAAIVMPSKESVYNGKTYESTYKASGTYNARTDAETGSAERETGSAEESQTEPGKIYRHRRSEKENRVLGGLILIALGGFFFLREFLPWISGSLLISVVFIGLGFYFLTRKSGE